MKLYANVKAGLRRRLKTDTRFRTRFSIYSLPIAYELLTWLDGSPEEKVVNRGTDLVIDGFPRSGQSYSVAVLHFTNPNLRLSTHAHSPRMLEKGVKAGIPTICLLREPRAAVASMFQFMPGVKLETAVEFYIRYYRRVARIRDDLLLVPFESATDDFGQVLRRINRRWGTAYEGYIRTEANEAIVRRMVEESARKNYSEGEFANVVAVPTRSRKSVDEVWTAASLDAMSRLRQASVLYESLRAGAD